MQNAKKETLDGAPNVIIARHVVGVYTSFDIEYRFEFLRGRIVSAFSEKRTIVQDIDNPLGYGKNLLLKCHRGFSVCYHIPHENDGVGLES